MTSRIPRTRKIIQTVTGSETRDGAGVRLRRIFPSPGLRMLDPFLLLDVFGSDDPGDYIAGFPPHPHRGFETVTYLLSGQVRHRDSQGHMGVVKAGGVQWMTAGKGVLHSEMPEQRNGLLHGFQLWVNLPAELKMGQPAYQEFGQEQIKQEIRNDGTIIRVIAGKSTEGTIGPVTGIATDATFLDISLPVGVHYSHPIPEGHNAFVYLISGSLRSGPDGQLTGGQLAVLDDGDTVEIEATEECRLLLIAGRPLGEPVARRGPFVMNTDEEINQAYRDFESGLFGEIKEDQGQLP